MVAWAGFCLLLSLAFGLGSVASYFWVDRVDYDRRIDATMVTVLLAAGSLAAFVVAICFMLASAA
ncbi:MAG: hypothetical protein E5V54_11250 [Mesorhizobium sp.]|nr:MAG: hypothetical protein E5V54_11250 [Mesorhizobium sp.]